MISTITLFLDIDGVLATEKSYETRGDNLDRDCIFIFNQLLDQFHFKIVISSSWKVMYSLKELRHLLQDLHAEIWGVTPTLGDRKEEIRVWLHQHHISHRYMIIDNDVDEIYPYFSEERIVHVRNGFQKRGFDKGHLNESITKAQNLL